MTILRHSFVILDGNFSMFFFCFSYESSLCTLTYNNLYFIIKMQAALQKQNKKKHFGGLGIRLKNIRVDKSEFKILVKKQRRIENQN